MTDTLTEPQTEPQVEVEGSDPDELEPADTEGQPLVDDELAEIPFIVVLAPEGVPTGDKRMFANGALSTRDLPLPIMFNPKNQREHEDAVVVGKLTSTERVGNIFRGKGVFWTSQPGAQQVIEGIIGGFYRGVSVDVDEAEMDTTEARAQMRDMMKAGSEIADPSELSDTDIEAELDRMFTPQTTVFNKARVAGATIVAIPAFQEAYIALGDKFPDELDESEQQALAACGCDQQLATEVPTEDEYEAFERGYDAFRPFPAAKREESAGKGHALPDGSFPIENVDDLKNAIQSIGRAKDPAKAKAHIKSRAAALGASDLIPDDWAGEVIVAGAEFAPGTHDGPGWITHPQATARLRRYWTHGKGAGKIRWGEGGDFNRCRSQLAKYVQNPEWLAGLCANMHKEALGIWPATHAKALGGGRHELEGQPFTLVASGGTRMLPAEWFTKPAELTSENPGLQIEGNHVFGYLAAFGVCHIGIPGKCETAPHSRSNYAYYRTGRVQTDAGPVEVGQITMGTGHANIRAAMGPAIEHYDHTGSAVADVATGEDDYGIWFSGAIREGVTQEARDTLAASGRLSGDWRNVAGRLELVAALAVNVPGFPLIRPALVASGEDVLSLVAAGVVADEAEAPVATQPVQALALDAATVAGIARTAVEEYVQTQKLEARRIEMKPTVVQLRSRVRTEAVARLRRDLNTKGL